MHFDDGRISHGIFLHARNFTLNCPMSFDVYLDSVVSIGRCVTSAVIVANYSPLFKCSYRRGMENYGTLCFGFKITGLH